MAGTVGDLEQALKAHLGGDSPERPALQPQQAFSDSSPSSEDGVPHKRQRFESESREEDVEEVPLVFSSQGEWIAAYYDDQFYIGQVIEVHSETEATVQYLTKARGRSDYFRWPEVEDIAKTSVNFVFRSSVDVVPVSNDGRVWKVSSADEIAEAYNRIKVRAQMDQNA